MRIALRYMGEKHRFREKPEIISFCNKNKVTLKKDPCACDPQPNPVTKVHVKNIPFGKRYFECDPCKEHLVCDPLIAETATLQELRDLWRTQCCPECNK